MSISKGDVLAAIDVVTELINESDNLPVDEALAFHSLLNELKSEAQRAIGFVETRAKVQLEGSPRQIGDRLYAVKRDGKSRFRHDAISAAIRVRAIQPHAETGEIPSAGEAVDRAIELMAMGYRSPADQPKVALLETLNLTRTQVSSWEHTGSKIVITDLSTPEDDA